MILRLALFLSGSLVGALVGYIVAPRWTEADVEDLALEEASIEPYRAALGWNATGEAVLWTHAPGDSFARVSAKADCE